MKIVNSRSYPWLVYTILWGMVWAYPVLTALIAAARTDVVVSWPAIRHAWECIMPFFLLFLLHRLPVHYLFMRHRIRVYLLSAAVLLALFGFCHQFTGMKRYHEPFRQERRQEFRREPPEGRPFRPFGRGPRSEGLPKPLMLDLMIAALMLGFDLAIALLARYQEEQEKSRSLEAAHLRYELEHLKAQLNPHFLMNMLNNIHGMVEVDPAKAQVMIMELSKLMRYVLYEGAKPRTTLDREMEFMASYVELMRKRYSSRKVRVNLVLPTDNRERVSLPPLLFISIIENAFKHGISYQSPSFVEILLTVENGRLRFECTNSNHRRQPKEGCAGGVGLVNLRQRLQLLYDDRFTLHITDDGTTYHVKLTIPYEYEKDKMYSR